MKKMLGIVSVVFFVAAALGCAKEPTIDNGSSTEKSKVIITDGSTSLQKSIIGVEENPIVSAQITLSSGSESHTANWTNGMAFYFEFNVGKFEPYTLTVYEIDSTGKSTVNSVTVTPKAYVNTVVRVTLGGGITVIGGTPVSSSSSSSLTNVYSSTSSVSSEIATNSIYLPSMTVYNPLEKSYEGENLMAVGIEGSIILSNNGSQFDCFAVAPTPWGKFMVMLAAVPDDVFFGQNKKMNTADLSFIGLDFKSDTVSPATFNFVIHWDMNYLNDTHISLTNMLWNVTEDGWYQLAIPLAELKAAAGRNNDLRGFSLMTVDSTTDISGSSFSVKNIAFVNSQYSILTKEELISW